jgi:hypothetical protein
MRSKSFALVVIDFRISVLFIHIKPTLPIKIKEKINVTECVMYCNRIAPCHDD